MYHWNLATFRDPKGLGFAIVPRGNIPEQMREDHFVDGVPCMELVIMDQGWAELELTLNQTMDIYPRLMWELLDWTADLILDGAHGHSLLAARVHDCPVHTADEDRIQRMAVSAYRVGHHLDRIVQALDLRTFMFEGADPTIGNPIFRNAYRPSS